MSEYKFDDSVSFSEVADLPSHVEVEESVCTVFLDEHGEVSDPWDLDQLLGLNKQSEMVAADAESVRKDLREKAFEHSTQSKKEIDVRIGSYDTVVGRIVPPPYDPVCLANFLTSNEVHFRAVKTKVQDSVGRDYKIIPKHPIRREETKEKDQVVGDHGESVTEKQFQSDCKKITNFIENCHDELTFQQLCFRAAMDREAIGWGAFEVIRQADGKVARIQHLPAGVVKVLEGWAGYVEYRGFSQDENKDIYTYYQPFGKKVVTESPDPFNPSKTKKTPYNPEVDGELDIFKNKALHWRLKDKATGEDIPGTQANFLKKAANEVIFFPNDHSFTRYYGYADVIPAISAIIANSYISDFQIQFFEHNCVPRYVVIIKGAKVDNKFKEYITEYFKTKVKGNTHKTMVLTLSGLGNKNVDIEFKQIDAAHKEADFQETKKQNDQIIMTAEGVSAALLAINESASLGSGKGLSQAELYKDRIVTILQRFWAQKMNTLFRLGLGVLYAEIEYDPLDVRDALATAQVLNILIIQGVLTINEARRHLGMKSIPGGDSAFVRIREGSAVKVSDLPDIESQLKNEGEVVGKPPAAAKKKVDKKPAKKESEKQLQDIYLDIPPTEDGIQSTLEKELTILRETVQSLRDELDSKNKE